MTEIEKIQALRDFLQAELTDTSRRIVPGSNFSNSGVYVGKLLSLRTEIQGIDFENGNEDSLRSLYASLHQRTSELLQQHSGETGVPAAIRNFNQLAQPGSIQSRSYNEIGLDKLDEEEPSSSPDTRFVVPNFADFLTERNIDFSNGTLASAEDWSRTISKVGSRPDEDQGQSEGEQNKKLLEKLFKLLKSPTSKNPNSITGLSILTESVKNGNPKALLAGSIFQRLMKKSDWKQRPETESVRLLLNTVKEVAISRKERFSSPGAKDDFCDAIDGILQQLSKPLPKHPQARETSNFIAQVEPSAATGASDPVADPFSDPNYVTTQPLPPSPPPLATPTKSSIPPAAAPAPEAQQSYIVPFRPLGRFLGRLAGIKELRESPPSGFGGRIIANIVMLVCFKSRAEYHDLPLHDWGIGRRNRDTPVSGQPLVGAQPNPSAPSSVLPLRHRTRSSTNSLSVVQNLTNWVMDAAQGAYRFVVEGTQQNIQRVFTLANQGGTHLANRATQPGQGVQNLNTRRIGRIVGGAAGSVGLISIVAFGVYSEVRQVTQPVASNPAPTPAATVQAATNPATLSGAPITPAPMDASVKLKAEAQSLQKAIANRQVVLAAVKDPDMAQALNLGGQSANTDVKLPSSVRLPDGRTSQAVSEVTAWFYADIAEKTGNSPEQVFQSFRQFALDGGKIPERVAAANTRQIKMDQLQLERINQQLAQAGQGSQR